MYIVSIYGCYNLQWVLFSRLGTIYFTSRKVKTSLLKWNDSQIHWILWEFFFLKNHDSLPGGFPHLPLPVGCWFGDVDDVKWHCLPNLKKNIYKIRAQMLNIRNPWCDFRGNLGNFLRIATLVDIATAPAGLQALVQSLHPGHGMKACGQTSTDEKTVCQQSDMIHIYYI